MIIVIYLLNEKPLDKSSRFGVMKISEVTPNLVTKLNH